MLLAFSALLWSDPAIWQAGHKVSVYLSPNYSLKAAWTSQWPIGSMK